jgi:Holliday junction resolvasome RuvABC ATP-dependent DNA helicase subunit
MDVILSSENKRRRTIMKTKKAIDKEDMLGTDKAIQATLVCGEVKTETDLSPLDEIIGQDGVKKQIGFFINSVSLSTPFPTLLLTGSKGLGKTYTSEKIARALGRKMVEFNCGSIKETNEFIEQVLIGQVSGQENVCLLMDESHELSFEITNFLLSLLNPSNKDGKFYFRYNGIDIEYDMNKVNVVFATTDAYMMFSPLVNRCREMYFSPYTVSEINLILEKYAEGINIKTENPNLAHACRRRARNAFSLAQDIVRHCSMEHTKVFDDKGWNSLTGIFGIYPMGVKSQEVRMLKILDENSPISLKNLSVVLGVNKKNIEDEISLWPRELGFLESGSRGTFISEEGKKYLLDNAKVLV